MGHPYDMKKNSFFSAHKVCPNLNKAPYAILIIKSINPDFQKIPVNKLLSSITEND